MTDKWHALNNPLTKAKDRCSNPRWHEDSNHKYEGNRSDKAKTWGFICRINRVKKKVIGNKHPTFHSYAIKFKHKMNLLYIIDHSNAKLPRPLTNYQLGLIYTRIITPNIVPAQNFFIKCKQKCVTCKGLSTKLKAQWMLFWGKEIITWAINYFRNIWWVHIPNMLIPSWA